MSKIVVTYKNADLDCVASAYAYSEFLNKKGEDSNYYISGIVQREVNIVCDLFRIKLYGCKDCLIDSDIIVVDTNSLSSVDFVLPEQIIEVIDHHPRTGDKFVNADVRIEQIGAVCTIIAEFFKNCNIEISRESAILLYYGIVSNTVNFNSNVTTKRDIEIANWLCLQCPEIDKSLVNNIFEEKSKIDIKNLRIAMEVEEIFNLSDNKMIIGQLEVVNAEDFLKNNIKCIDNIMNDVKIQYGITIIFINIIDILNGYHILYSPYRETQLFLNNNYNMCFINNEYKEDSIVLRKEIKKYLLDYENKNRIL